MTEQPIQCKMNLYFVRNVLIASHQFDDQTFSSRCMCTGVLPLCFVVFELTYEFVSYSFRLFSGLFVVNVEEDIPVMFNDTVQ